MKEIILTSILLVAAMLALYRWASPADNVSVSGDISEWTPEVKRYFGSTSVSGDIAPIPKNIAENKWLYFEN